MNILLGLNVAFCLSEGQHTGVLISAAWSVETLV